MNQIIIFIFAVLLCFLQVNKFQAILATDGSQTYVLYVYGDILATSNAGDTNVRVSPVQK